MEGGRPEIMYRVSRILLAIAVVAVAAALPLFDTPFITATMITVLMSGILAVSWNIFSGYTGYISLGHSVFFGAGAYTTAVFVTRLGLPPVAAIIVGGIAAMILALVSGYPCLRVRGIYFAIVTLALNETLKLSILDWESTSMGTIGMTLPPIYAPIETYYALLALLVSVMILSERVRNSRFGLHLLAIRDNEMAAETIGINTTGCKLKVFVLSAFFPGLTGGIMARYYTYIEPKQVFDLTISFQMAIMALFGGIGTVFGPLIGATFLGVVSDVLWARFPYLHLIIQGIIMILIVLFLPKGMMDIVTRLTRRGGPDRSDTTAGPEER